MAIWMMCEASEPGAVLDKAWSRPDSAIYVKESWAGLVLSTGEINGYDDSDFFATVWDDEAGKPRRITYASTRGWTYPNGAKPDASPEVLEKYEAWCAEQRAMARKLAEEREAKTPRVGKRVKIVAGRKVPQGTEWWVCGDEPDRYRAGERRLALRSDAGERAWTSARNVEVIDWEG